MPFILTQIDLYCENNYLYRYHVTNQQESFMKASAATLIHIVSEIIQEEVRNVEAGHKVYAKEIESG